MITPDPVELLDLLAATSASVGLALDRALGEPKELSQSLLAILRRVSARPEGQATMGEIAVEVGLSGGGLTRAMDRLVALNLVTRENDPQDRRVVRIRLTAEGRRRLTRGNRLETQVADRLFEELSPAEIRQLAVILAKIQPVPTPSGGSK